MEGLHFLYVRFAPDVRRYVASLVQNQHEAEDITQDVFAKLVTAIRKYERRQVPFAAWILRVARNAALDHIRAKREIPADEVRVADQNMSETRNDRGRALRIVEVDQKAAAADQKAVAADQKAGEARAAADAVNTRADAIEKASKRMVFEPPWSASPSTSARSWC